MAAYPLTVWTKRSTRRVITNVLSDETGGGEMLVRVVGNPQYLFTLDHRLISSSDASTLDTFWGNNKTALVQVTWNSVVYDCRFTPHGAQVQHDKGPYWRATSQLRGVPQ